MQYIDAARTLDRIAELGATLRQARIDKQLQERWASEHELAQRQSEAQIEASRAQTDAAKLNAESSRFDIGRRKRAAMLEAPPDVVPQFDQVPLTPGLNGKAVPAVDIGAATNKAIADEMNKARPEGMPAFRPEEVAASLARIKRMATPLATGPAVEQTSTTDSEGRQTIQEKRYPMMAAGQGQMSGTSGGEVLTPLPPGVEDVPGFPQMASVPDASTSTGRRIVNRSELPAPRRSAQVSAPAGMGTMGVTELTTDTGKPTGKGLLTIPNPLNPYTPSREIVDVKTPAVGAEEEKKNIELKEDIVKLQSVYSKIADMQNLINKWKGDIVGPGWFKGGSTSGQFMNYLGYATPLGMLHPSSAGEHRARRQLEMGLAQLKSAAVQDMKSIRMSPEAMKFLSSQFPTITDEPEVWESDLARRQATIANILAQHGEDTVPTNLTPSEPGTDVDAIPMASADEARAFGNDPRNKGKSVTYFENGYVVKAKVK